MPTPAGDTTGVGNAALPYSCEVFASAARTADPITTSDLGFAVPRGANALKVVVVTTSITSTPSVVVNIEGYEPASGTWVTLLAMTAITATGTDTGRIWPGNTVSAGARADDILPDKIRIRPVHADSDSITYSIGATFSET